MLVVAPSADPELQQCARKAGGVTLLLDPGAKAAKRYNALWRPRAYAVDEGGHLCYVQPETTPDAQAPLEVAPLWERGR